MASWILNMIISIICIGIFEFIDITASIVLLINPTLVTNNIINSASFKSCMKYVLLKVHKSESVSKLARILNYLWFHQLDTERIPTKRQKSKIQNIFKKESQLLILLGLVLTTNGGMTIWSVSAAIASQDCVLGKQYRIKLFWRPDPEHTQHLDRYTSHV